jgi:hypothetical protein
MALNNKKTAREQAALKPKVYLAIIAVTCNYHVQLGMTACQTT